MVGIDELSENWGPGPGFQGEKMLVSGSGKSLACFYFPFLGCFFPIQKKSGEHLAEICH